MSSLQCRLVIVASVCKQSCFPHRTANKNSPHVFVPPRDRAKYTLGLLFWSWNDFFEMTKNKIKSNRS